MALVLMGTFFLLLVLDVPVAASMGVAAIAGMMYGGFGIDAIATTFLSSISSFTMLAIPFFILAGIVMEYAGISKRLIHFADTCVGHRKGGLTIVTVVTACFFAAISGSGPATVAALSGILVPSMVKNGYDRTYSATVIAASGGIGMIIPPSIPFVIYAMLAEVSVGTMFLSGIIPGILFGIAYCITALFLIRDDKQIIVKEKASGKERWEAFKEAFWGILSPIIILGGIYSGIFTATEAAGVAAVYSLFVGIFIYKEIKIKQLPEIVMKANLSCAVIMYIMAAAGTFTWILTTSGLAGQLSEALLGITGSETMLILLMMVIFMIAGCFVDSASGFYLLMPILLPVVRETGFNLYAFGVLATANFAIGQITPPVGSNLFVACNVAHVEMVDICKRVGPFIIAGLIVLVFLVFFPGVITFLPELLGSSTM